MLQPLNFFLKHMIEKLKKVMKLNIKKAIWKVMLLTIVTLMWVWTSIQASAGYIEWVFVWNNAQTFQNQNWFKAWITLFKMLKWNLNDKDFVGKYAKKFSELIDWYLSTNNSDWEKTIMLKTISALSKDITEQVEGKASIKDDKVDNWKEQIKEVKDNKNNQNKEETSEDFDYEKMTALKYPDKSSVLPWILKNIKNEWNQFLIKGSFDDFVEAYKDIKWMNDSQAIKAADEAFRTIYSYVKPWDVEWTLKGYVNLRDRYNIQRSRSEWGWQWASYTWVHWNWACYWKLRLSMLMLYMAWHDNMQMWEKDYWTDHIQLKIAWFTRYFDAVGATRINTWQHIWETLTREEYQALADSTPTQNTTQNINDIIWQDTTDKSIKWDISWGSFEGVNEFDFS